MIIYWSATQIVIGALEECSWVSGREMSDPPGRPRWKQIGIKVPTAWNVVIDEFCVSTRGPLAPWSAMGRPIVDGWVHLVGFSGGNRTEKKRPRGRQTQKRRRNKTVKGTTRWNAVFYLFIREEREIERKEHLGGPLVDDWLTLLDGQVDDQMPLADDRKGLERLIGPRLMGGQAALSFNTRHAHTALLLHGTRRMICPLAAKETGSPIKIPGPLVDVRTLLFHYEKPALLSGRHFRSQFHDPVASKRLNFTQNLDPVFKQCVQQLSRLPLFSINYK